MEGANISVTSDSRAMLGNIFTLFQSLLSLRWAMFATFKYLSRRSILEIVTSGVMFDHMGAMLVSLLLTTIPEPYLSLSLLLTTIPGPYLSLSLLLTSHVPGRSSPYLEETCLR